MPSLLPDYEYDIFISYRHKDNRSDKWVSQFVQALREELDTTFKENISVYFDENPFDGLLENHSVNQSLNNKLKSVIFIPIISQTYCDPNSYAWQYEFCLFNKVAREEPIGRDIRLSNGNVASRILPVTIHDLEASDIQQIESELDAKFRYVEFTYRSPGVNRALRKDDRREDNLKQLAYRDQMNKVANALKEIIQGIQKPEKVGYGTISASDQDSAYLSGAAAAAGTILTDLRSDSKSIAVLPFRNLSKDESQEYFAEGITENIIMQLASIKTLKVISRTTTARYKNTTMSAPEIAKELSVKYILEGSAQSSKDKVRINVQLLDAEQDDPIWSKVFSESMEDVFSVQDLVADAVAEQLKASIASNENLTHEKPTQNLEAYDLFLKGRHAFNQWNVEGYQVATDYFKKAIALDPEFKQAYSYLASCYSARMSWNGDLSGTEALPLINQYLDIAITKGASDNDHLTKAFVELFIHKDFDASEKSLLAAQQINHNNANVLYTYSYLLCLSGRLTEAQQVIDRAKEIEPLSVAYFNYQGICLFLRKDYEGAAKTFEEGLRLFPKVIRFYDHLGRLYLTAGKYEDAKSQLEMGLAASNVRQASMVAFLGACHWHLGQEAEAEKILNELMQRGEQKEKGIHFNLAYIHLAMGEKEKAIASIFEAVKTNDAELIWLDIDPLLSPIQDRVSLAKIREADFEGAEKFISQKLKKELPTTLTYHNVAHVDDVLQSAVNIAKAEGTSEEEIKLVRIAALYHDSGFITTYKGHEANGCELAKETLPSFRFSESQIDQICSMIMATKIPQSPQNKLDQILCDADLDYLGRDDFFEIGDRLYAEMKDRGFLENEREWNLTQKVFLENHRYHTPTSKSKREAKKQEHLAEVMAKLKK
ncbi:MAG: tetratricopeptide repeat protein [Cyclobacteriaceae bacterium]